MIDKRFVLLNESDNILVCCKYVPARETISINERIFVIPSDINVGHKLAYSNIAKGEKIIKYGVAIGSATTTINTGEHVHLHNIKSDYISSHTRASKVGEN